MRKILFILLFLFSVHAISSQVLLTLIFGEKLNSPNIEFGLEGGYNFSDISGLDSSERLGTFNLGFYFNFKLKEQFYLYTGVLVKSNLGTRDLRISDLETIGVNFIGNEGSYSQRINYFIVPVFAKYVFGNNIYMEAGPQLGLRYKAYVEYTNDADGVDTRIRQDNKDAINPIEAGAGIGLGYRFKKIGGLSVELNYFQGFVNVYKANANTKNNAFFLKLNLPIGAKKSTEPNQDNQLIEPASEAN